jgi:predicted ATPase/class 3 adenylate cyclase
MQCRNCHTTNNQTTVLCISCGEALAKCHACNFANLPAAKYCGGCGKPLTPSNQDEAVPERRQGTVLFCDLVDSTNLVDQTKASPKDLEDYREILRSFQKACDAVIAEYAENEETITDYIGDGVVVLFGFPKGREDDAERAVRAGLELITAIQNLSVLPNVKLGAHVGIATDIGVVGDRIGKGASGKTTVIGPAPNLASRLQGIARSGEVIISDKTHELVGNLFECEDLGFKPLKGFDRPVRAWNVLGECPGVSRFEAIRAKSGVGPLVGRVTELDTLAQRWELAKIGSGQVVTLIGEPGIGKSRLIRAFLESITRGHHHVLRFFTSPRFQNTALYPVIQQLQQLTGIHLRDAPGEKFSKLEMVVANSGAKAKASLPYLAALLSIPPEAGYNVIRDIPEMQKQRTLDALKTFIDGLAIDKPLILVWEDLHWADRTTLDFLEQLVGAIGRLPVLLLATGRLEFSPPWSENAHTLKITLPRLHPQEAAKIVSYLADDKMIPASTREQILSRSDGIPLFIEELTKAVVETDAVQADPTQSLGKRSSPMRVPSTLHDSLMARLDRLATGKEVALLASAIGREFSYDLLAAVHGTPGAELVNALSRLIDADLIHARGTPPNSSYAFKHALIQEEAYGSMLRDKRQGLHSRIAQVLETQGDTAASLPELLAHHLTAAGQPAKALPYWKDAGSRAKERAAYAEGCTHLAQALELVDHAPPSLRRHLELELQLQLGYCVQAARGYAAPEVAAAYQRARELCSLLGDTAELYPVLRGLFVFYQVRCEFTSARELAEQCVRLGKETYVKDSKRPEYLIEGYNALGYVLFYQGELQEALQAFTQAVELYRAHDGHRLSYPFVPQDPAVAALSALAIVAWMLGDNRRATQCSEEALALAESLNRPFDRAYAHCFLAMLENIRRQYARACDHAGKTVKIAQEFGFAIWLGAGTLHLAIAMGGLGQATQALEYLTPALAGWEGCGAKLNLAFFLAGSAETYRRAGLDKRASEALDKAIRHAIHHREHFYDAALYRVRGELRANPDKPSVPNAEKDFSEAVEIARQQGAIMLELVAAISWYRAWLVNEGSDRSRQALEVALQNFKESDADIPEVQEGYALLGEKQKI